MFMFQNHGSPWGHVVSLFNKCGDARDFDRVRSCDVTMCSGMFLCLYYSVLGVSGSYEP